MQLYKLLVLLAGEGRVLFIRRMRYPCAIFYVCFLLMYACILLGDNICCKQVFLDIVESVNLLMSSKGENWILLDILASILLFFIYILHLQVVFCVVM